MATKAKGAVAESQVSTDSKGYKVVGLSSMPKIEKKTWTFVRGDEVFALEYTPISYAQQEQVNVEFPLPTPPFKQITDDKELLRRKASGLAPVEPDENDPEYKAELARMQTRRSLANVWKSLGQELTFDEFEEEIQNLLTPGEMLDLVTTVNRAAYQIDPLKLDLFFRGVGA